MTHTPGELVIDGEQATLRFERWLPHPVEAVWAAITEPAQREKWMGHTVVDARMGGQIDMVPADPPAPTEAKRMTGRITVWDPPRVFEHEWNQRIVESGSVRYELSPDNGGTRLVFTHRGLGVRNAGGFLPGTHAFLDRLVALLAGVTPPTWSQRYQQLARSIYANNGDAHDF